MKVLLLSSRLNLGGIGIYTVSLARSLKEKGVEVIVASSGGELVDSLKKRSIEHIDIPVATSADIGLHTLISYFKLKRVIRRDKIDIIHAQTRVTQIIAALLSKKLKIGFVTTCHGFFKQKLFRKIFPCWGKRTIAISDAVRQHLVVDMKVPKEKTALIYNGIDINRFKQRKSTEDKKLIKNDYGLKQAPVIGVISRLSSVKGHKYLIAAFAKLLKDYPDLQLLIVGDGSMKYLSGLKSQIKKLGIEKSIVFLGACHDTSIPLSIIDVFCLPSIQEGLGLAILEAMIMKVPVVASNVGGIYTLINHGKNGLLIPPKDEDALADAISEILLDKNLAKKMGLLSKKLVEEKFSLDLMRDSVIDVYREVIDTNDKELSKK